MNKTQQQLYEIEDFPNFCHLWNIVPGGSGKGIVFLRKIVDSIHNNSYSRPGCKLPSFLIMGEGKSIVSMALMNSLALEDIRVVQSQYLDAGINSRQFFSDITSSTAFIIENIEKIRTGAESILWRFLKLGRCGFQNLLDKEEIILHIDNIIVLTSKEENIYSIPKTILDSVDYVIQLEPYTTQQLQLIVHQLLKFSSIIYEEKVLKEIVGDDPLEIKPVIQFLKTCIVVMRSELEECLTLEIVKKAKRLY